MTDPITADQLSFDARRVSRRAGECSYRLIDDERGIELEASRLRRDHHELCGELVVYCGIKGAKTVDGCLSSGSFNFSSTQTRERLASYLRGRARTGEG